MTSLGKAGNHRSGRGVPRLAAVAAALALAIVATEGALAQDAADRGRQISHQWCSSCHLVDPGQVVSDGAPSFFQIANDPYITPERLRGWLAAPHEPMPDLNLTRREVDDVVTYLESLKAE
jgi:mono/diheme cytochrome c family protein